MPLPLFAAALLAALLARPSQPVGVPPARQHDMSAPSTWMLMADGSATVMFNSQGGPRGEAEVRAPNWWMGMASHRLGRGTFTGQAMISAEPATVGKCGYSELFQVGETCNGNPLVDRQHPHDLTGQLAIAWRVPVGGRTALTFAGGPVGEPALGPVAYMHRPSADANPVAPLSHHTFDSTHIAMGVATAALDRAPFVVEASVFNGREPDENRWNLMDAGPWDSWAARVWYVPSPEWQIQVSTGHLVQPEALEPGNIQRTTASIGWLRRRGDGFSAVSGGYGRNDKSHDTLNATFVEATDRRRSHEIYGRFEALQVETTLLATAGLSPPGEPLPIQTVVAVTGGVLRDLVRPHGFEIGLGADITAYRVPPALAPSHGSHPVSFHVFVRVRPPAPMGRMWNMTMTGLLAPRHAMMPDGQGPM